jgi:hypothetical protein
MAGFDPTPSLLSAEAACNWNGVETIIALRSKCTAISDSTFVLIEGEGAQRRSSEKPDASLSDIIDALSAIAR